MKTAKRILPTILLAGVLGLAGCGGDGGDGGDGGAEDPPRSPAPGTAAPETPQTPSSPEAGVELFEFEISGGEVSPELSRAEVAAGTQVRIVVTSDQPDEIHLHGYDLTADTGPDQPGVIEFEADQRGLFELETHDSGLVLLQLQVR